MYHWPPEHHPQPGHIKEHPVAGRQEEQGKEGGEFSLDDKYAYFIGANVFQGSTRDRGYDDQLSSLG